MLQLHVQPAPLSPPIAAFWARNSRGAQKKSHINLRAIPEPEQRLRIKRPKLRSKNKGGAPKGNRNALSTGLHTCAAVAERHEMRCKVRQVIATMKMLTAQVRAEAALKDAETMRRLMEAGLPRRAIWLSEI